jgi:hypothetical protein
MNKKKYITLKGRKIRQLIKGINLPLSIKLAKLSFFECTKFIETLEKNGFKVEEVIEGYCPDDGDPEGYLRILKDGKEVGNVEFTCSGLYIKV